MEKLIFTHIIYWLIDNKAEISSMNITIFDKTYWYDSKTDMDNLYLIFKESLE